MWGALARLGFTGGDVLEPGCGAGTFIGTALAGARMHGVELDPVTAAIAAHLYPDASITAASFADTQFPDGAFAAVIGNVPFADVRLHDPRHNPGRRSIHNHFLIKSLALTRPGGYVLALTSRYTLDARDPGARAEMHALGDLVGAVRLPTGAHRATAGTDAVTDLLILRRRPTPPDTALTPTSGPAWLTTTTQTTADGAEYALNGYFAEHPDHVLGTAQVGPGMYGATTLTIHPTSGQDTADLLDAVLTGITDTALSAGPDAQAGGDSTGITPQELTPATPAPVEQDGPSEVAVRLPVTRAGNPSGFDGYTRYDPDTGTFTRTTSGFEEPLEVPTTQTLETRQLLGLRDAVIDLLQLEAETADDTAQIAEARAELNTRYDTYVARFGPLNRVTLARGKADEDGNPGVRRLVPATIRRFKADPFAPPVLALENYDEAAAAATKAQILSERVVAPRLPRSAADSPADALAICLDTHGLVDLQQIADLLDTTPEQARAALDGMVFHDPALERLVVAEEYLSGDVRQKLTQAVSAVLADPSLQANIDALAAVQPVDLGPDEIDVRLGAPWVPDTDVTAFLTETLHDRRARAEHAGGSTWAVEGNTGSVDATSTWGTDRLNAIAMTGRLLRQQQIVVRDTIVDADGLERRVINPDETAAAQEKAHALGERFAEWVWEDPARAARLAGIYNTTFNAIRLREYDTTHLTLPGLARGFTPMAHQKIAVARMVSEPSVGLFHEVGAGKTAEMVMGVMELRRLGMVRKPAIVVPTHMLEQFARELLQLYPQANILAAGSADLKGDARRLFVARAATGDWDAVVLTRTAFQRLPVSRQAQADYQERSLDQLRTQLETARANGTRSLTVKTIQKAIARAEENLKFNLAGPRDDGLTFEQTGIDYLCVDELHDYKNLPIPTNIAGVTNTGVNVRATDLDLKIDLLRHTHGDRVVTGATATPIANSVAEAYVMQRYLRPDLLAAAGLTDFDSWAAAFGEHITEIELAPEGGGNFRTATRFARFRNVPEMLRMWHASADIKTAEDLDLPRPSLATRPDGRQVPEIISVPGSDALTAYVRTLGERAERVRARQVSPTEDNMLTISSDGRAAALDMRLVTPKTRPGTGTSSDADTTSDAGAHDLGMLFEVPTKLDVAADRIHGLWAEHRNDPYTAAYGSDEPSSKPGALQLVFADLGTPGPGKDWSVYDGLKDRLTAAGMDPTRVRFIHEASTDAEKARLFSQCRNGDVDVIIGSTQKMGVGTNIQNRAIAIHHLDCPWRPADVAQREGRVLRQGNQNPEVQILRYVVAGSFDAYMWQAVERKAKFISQVMRGTLETRAIDDVGDNALSFNEIKAIASGDPRILQLAHAQQNLVTLERLERGHGRNQTQLRFGLGQLRQEAETLTEGIAAVTIALAGRVPTAGEAFHATIDGRPFTSRPDAAAAVRARLTPHLASLTPQTRPTATVPNLIDLGGHHFRADLQILFGQPRAEIHLPGVPVPGVQLTRDDLTGDGHGLVTKLENVLNRLEQNLTDKTRQLATTREETARAETQIGQPFLKRDDLERARTEVADLTDRLEQASAPRPQPAPADGTDSTGITPTTAATPDSPASDPPAGMTRLERARQALAAQQAAAEQAGTPAAPPKRLDPRRTAPRPPRRAPRHDQPRPDTHHGPSLR